MKNRKIIATVFVAFILSMVLFWIPEKAELPLVEAMPAVVALEDTLCNRHILPESQCFFCDPSLREPGRLWCNEHERYEDRCFICHPELKEEDRLWCEAHKLYEDECFICHPELMDEFFRAETTGAQFHPNPPVRVTPAGSLQCLEHGVLEKECGICHPELIDTLPIGEGLKIRLESPDAAGKAGIESRVPTAGTSRPRISFFGKTTYDQNRFARITPLTGGSIRDVLADVGASVSEGQLLAEISSPDMAQAQSSYVSALAEEALRKIVFEREERLMMKRISAQQDYEQARAEYRMAASNKEALLQQLLNYGFTRKQLYNLEETRSGSSSLFIRAPFAGMLVGRNAVIGNAVQPGDTLFDLADISSMWIELSIPESSLNRVKVSDLVEVTFDVLPELSVRGQVTWIAANIDERTRMLKGRAVVPNTGLQLKQGMFCRVHLLSEEHAAALFISVDALQTLNKKPFVFVKLSDDLYEARRIAAGGRDRGVLEILEGISPHEEVVVKHSFTLKAEFFKSRLGAGCVDE